MGRTAGRFELDLYAGKRVLLTGDTGFKGSWLALWLNAGHSPADTARNQIHAYMTERTEAGVKDTLAELASRKTAQ